jgi:hypothetical protein
VDDGLPPGQHRSDPTSMGLWGLAKVDMRYCGSWDGPLDGQPAGHASVGDPHTGQRYPIQQNGLKFTQQVTGPGNSIQRAGPASIQQTGPRNGHKQLIGQPSCHSSAVPQQTGQGSLPERRQTSGRSFNRRSSSAATVR